MWHELVPALRGARSTRRAARVHPAQPATNRSDWRFRRRRAGRRITPSSNPRGDRTSRRNARPIALLDGGTARTGQRMSTWCIMASSMADVLPGAFSLIAKAPRPAREVSGTMCASSPFLWQALGPMSTSLTLAVISIARSEPDFTRGMGMDAECQPQPASSTKKTGNFGGDGAHQWRPRVKPT